MWFVSYIDDISKNKRVSNLFPNKIEAFRYIENNLKGKRFSDVLVLNSDTSLASDEITEGSLLFIKTDNRNTFYGKVYDISNYLITIQKNNGALVELTKNRFNKEYINGLFTVKLVKSSLP